MAKTKAAAKTGTKRAAVVAKASKGKGFTDEEKGAMRSRIREMQLGEGEGEAAVLAKIAEMRDSDRALATKLHAIVRASAPSLLPKLWYGMPAYYKDGKALCFFQPAQKFKTRYASVGFNDGARLDDGDVWPIAYALSKLTAADEARIGALLKKAVS